MTRKTPASSVSEPLTRDPSQVDVSVPAPNEERVLRMLDVGTRIALARQRKGWTQLELSRQLGKTRGTVVQYEQGRIEPPLRQLETIANLLDVAPELLAFGRQGIAGLGDDMAEVASIPEVRLTDEEEVVSGAYGLPAGLIADFGAAPNDVRVVVLTHSMPAYGLAAGDRIIVNAADQLEHADRLYALRSRRGVDVVRLLPNLSSRDDAVKINDGNGQTHSYERGELETLGRVIASIRAE